jgi:hypothetical protein
MRFAGTFLPGSIRFLIKGSNKEEMNILYLVRPYECNMSGSLCFSNLYTLN